MKFSILLLLYFFAAVSYASNNTICTNGFNLINNKCWKLFTDAANHTAAERTCTGYGGTLFMAKNAIDNRAVGTYVASSGVNFLWTGVYCYGSDRSQCYWDDQTGTTVSYANFAPGFPNAGTGRCVYYSVFGSPSGQWISGDCTHQLAYVCELPPTHPDICEFNFNDNCYFQFDALPFTAAQKQCEQLCGDMVSIHSAEENRYILSIYSKSSSNFITLGGIVPSSDFIVWNDGSIMNYNNIEIYDASGSCLYLSLISSSVYSLGSWYTGSCSVPKHFLCKRPVGALDCRGTPAPPTPAPSPIPTPTCSTGVHVAPGFISSPNYPNPYRSGCQYTLTTFGSNRIRITFIHLWTYPNYDYVSIYDGESTDAPLIVTKSGNCGDVPYTYTSTGNTMFVDFGHIGSACTCNGFNATFYSIF